MKQKTIIYLTIAISLLFLSGCTSNNDIELKLDVFGKREVKKCKENIQYWFEDFDKYCTRQTSLCNEIYEVKNILEENCNEIGIATENLKNDLIYNSY